VYTPFTQASLSARSDEVNLVVRFRHLDAASLHELHERLESAGVAVIRIRPLSSVINEAMAPPRLRMDILAGFAAVALALALCGLYALTAGLARARRREIGVRLACGAGYQDIVRLLAADGPVLALAGASIGYAAMVAGGAGLGAAWFGLQAPDYGISAATGLLLIAAAAATAIGPAHRAAKMDPARILRDLG
ncbi:MAG: FtsX-like permease family protein, partial [Terriglobales bacterium]